MFNKINIFLLVLLLLSGCVSIPSHTVRNEHARKLASDRGWVSSLINTDNFLLQAYVPAKLKSAKELTIYIEGDGLAWINRSTPSFNPTPANPLALKLALQDDKPAAYLARPCQYVSFDQSPNCSQKYWSSYRFAPEVIHATSQAIDQLKLKFGAESLVLIGYSGGGAVAALVAAQRKDISYLMTIAGNLDHQTWTNKQQLSPLEHSLNPADYADKLQNIKQTHFVGGNDGITGEFVARAYSRRFVSDLSKSIVVMPDFDHACCWQMYWPDLKNSKLNNDEK